MTDRVDVEGVASWRLATGTRVGRMRKGTRRIVVQMSDEDFFRIRNVAERLRVSFAAAARRVISKGLQHD